MQNKNTYNFRHLALVLLPFLFAIGSLQAQPPGEPKGKAPKGLKKATTAFLKYCECNDFSEGRDKTYPDEYFKKAPLVFHKRANPERENGDFSAFPSETEKKMLAEACGDISRGHPPGVKYQLEYKGWQEYNDKGGKVHAYEIETLREGYPRRVILAFIKMGKNWVLVDID